MKKILNRSAICILLAGACAAAHGYSNPIEGGAVQTVTNQWAVSVPWLVVGSNSDSNTLVVVEGGEVNNSIAYLGNTADSSHNEVQVQGTGAVWNSSMELTIGHLGGTNTLTVSDGGVASTDSAYIGKNSDSNRAIISDADSLLAAENLYVGYLGDSNAMAVANGGRVESTDANIGYWIGADGNQVEVSGEGSLWSNSGSLNVGNYGSGNTLSVYGGGQVDTEGLNVGVQAMATNNLVSVSDEGSLLNASEINIGGNGNLVEVQNGGTIATELLTIQNGGAFDLNDGGTFAIDNDFDVSTNGFNWNEGGTLEVHGELTKENGSVYNRTLVLNGTNALWNRTGNLNVSGTDGQMVITNGASVMNDEGAIGYSNGEDGSSVMVSGEGSTWINSGRLDVGRYGDDSSLTIQDGGVVESRLGVIGYASHNNTVTVDGDGSAWSNSLSVTVGYNGSQNILAIQNGATVQNSGYAHIGQFESSDGNQVFVSGAGSVWTNGGLLSVGNIGADDNRLEITDGGVVYNGDAVVGGGSSVQSADNNAVLVSGTDSLWQNAGVLTVGRYGSGNSLVITNGGTVENTVGTIGERSDSDNNQVVVSGVGSVWNNSGDLTIGSLGSGNLLIVTNGGSVFAESAYVGSNADDNHVLVTGSGSVFSNSANVTVGDSSSGNSIEIAEGGQMYSQRGYIGGSGSNNTVLVSGEGSRWEIGEGLDVSGAGNALYIGAGSGVLVGDADVLPPSSPEYGFLNVGSTSSVPEMLVANESRVEVDGRAYIGYGADQTGRLEITGGSELVATSHLTVGYAGTNNVLEIADGATALTQVGTIGANEAGFGNSVLVAGAGSAWSNTVGLVVGDYGSGNTLTVSNGATVYGDGIQIGFKSTGDDNQVAVTGAGSKLISRAGIKIGADGAGNTLTVSDGGIVENQAGYAYVGYGSGSHSNLVEITGEGSAWSNSHFVVVGRESSGNRIQVSDGGTLYSDSAIIGDDATASGNSVSVSGVGSVWNSVGDLYVGYEGTRNALLISDGGKVVNLGSGYLGYNSGSSNNLVDISGAGSSWSTAGELIVGRNGSGNRIEVSDGGALYSAQTVIGDASSSSNNTVTVSGAGSSWINDGDLIVGNEGSGNTMFLDEDAQLHVEDGVIVGLNSSYNRFALQEGSEVWSESVSLGFNEGSDGNRVLVEESRWEIECGLDIGNRGANNLLVITNGATVSGTSLVLGRDSNGNKVEVFGMDSELNFNSELIVGLNGSSNVVVIKDGSQAQGRSIDIGYSASANGNSMLIDAASLELSGMTVGRNGSGNRITLSGGGEVFSFQSLVGDASFSSNNAVAVSGAGSSWINDGDLVVGNEGSGNSVSISDGGRVESVATYIGYATRASDNSVEVSGAVLSSAGALSIGTGGTSNRLLVDDGGVVENATGIIGMEQSSANNLATVSGAGSSWSNSGELHVGYGGANNSLYVSDGGLVSASNSYVGTMSDNNIATVEHAGSEWSTSASLYIGYQGSSNELSVLDGGRVESGDAFIGYDAMASGNAVTVSGNMSTWASYGELHVGASGGDNGLYISSGGLVSASDSYIGTMSDNNFASVQHSGSEWINSGDLFIGYQGSSNVLSVLDGGRVESDGAFIGYDAIASGNSVSVSGDLSTWSNDGELYVGYGGADNALLIEDGGMVASSAGIIGALAGADGNLVSVVGAGSEWDILGNLYIGGSMQSGSWADGGSGNSLYVGDGGLVTIGDDLYNRNDSSVSIDPGSRIDIAGDYYQDAISSLRFGVETNAAGAPVNALVSVGGTAEFEEGATIEYASTVGALEFDIFYTNKIVEAAELIVAGKEDPDALDLEMLDASGTLVDVVFWEDDSDIYGLVGRVHLADSAGFESGSMMSGVAREIDELSLQGSTPATHMIALLNNMTAEEQQEQLEQQYMRGLATYQHARGMTAGMKEVKKHITHSSQWRKSAPQGAAGPYRPEQGVQAWAKPYGVWADYSAADGFSGYDHSIYGTVVGLDLPIENALLGVAGGYVRSNIDQDDGDNSQARGGYGMLYIGTGTDDWFGDVNVAYGRSQVELESGSIFGNTAEFDASSFAVYIGGGKEMKLNRRLIVTPKASALWSYYYQPGYTEESSESLAREVDMFERNSLLSTLGVTVAWQKEFETAVLKPQVRLNWLHEFNSDSEEVAYAIVDGRGGEFHYAMPGAVSDVAEIGAGVACRFDEQLELVVDIDGRFGEDYSAYALSGRMVFEF